MRRTMVLSLLAVAACSDGGPAAPSVPCENATGQRTRAESLDLEVGELLVLCDPDAMAAVRLPGGESPREYLVVVANVDAIADQLQRFDIRWSRGGTGGAAAMEQGPLAGALPLTGTRVASPSSPPLPAPPAELVGEMRIRLFERTLPAPAAAATLWETARRRPAPDGAARRSLTRVDPVIGDEIIVRVPDANGSNLCFDFATVSARVRAVSRTAVLLEDVAAPAGGFDDGDYERLAAEFDDLHAAVVSTYFGDLPDVDGDGRVHLLVTPEVNRVSAGSVDSFVSGFFFGGDLIPRFGDALWPNCLQSNEGEILYLVAPDPAGRFGARRSADDVRRQVRGTMVHELQHMANFGVRMRSRAEPEAVWLNEALSHLAEELAGRRRRGLGDFQHVGTIDLIDASIGFRDYQAFFVQNLMRFRTWLSRPDTTSPTSASVRTHLAPRGAAWALLRHVADHHADDQLPAFLRRLTAGPKAGVANLEDATGERFESLLSAWLIANYADDLALPVDAGVRYRSWRMRNAVSDATSSTPTSGAPYPLRITLLADDGGALSVGAVSGSASYHAVRDASAAGGGVLSLRAAPRASPLESGARLMLLRVR